MVFDTWFITIDSNWRRWIFESQHVHGSVWRRVWQLLDQWRSSASCEAYHLRKPIKKTKMFSCWLLVIPYIDRTSIQMESHGSWSSNFIGIAWYLEQRSFSKKNFYFFNSSTKSLILYGEFIFYIVPIEFPKVDA